MWYLQFCKQSSLSGNSGSFRLFVWKDCYIFIVRIFENTNAIGTRLYSFSWKLNFDSIIIIIIALDIIVTFFVFVSHYNYSIGAFKCNHVFSFFRNMDGGKTNWIFFGGIKLFEYSARFVEICTSWWLHLFLRIISSTRGAIIKWSSLLGV